MAASVRVTLFSVEASVMVAVPVTFTSTVAARLATLEVVAMVAWLSLPGTGVELFSSYTPSVPVLVVLDATAE